MHVVGQALHHGTEQVRAAIVLVALGVLVFWRVIARMLFAIMAIVAIAAVIALGAGVVALLHR